MRNKDFYSKKIDFKNHKLGLYDLKTFVDDWGSEPRRGIVEKRCKIIKNKGEKLLEVMIPKNTESKGGSFWRLNFPRNLTDCTLEYDILFGKNFDFVRGGKMPGLGGGESKGCGGTPEQYQNGFSARLMWREIDFEKEIMMKENLRKKMKALKKKLKTMQVDKKEILDNLDIFGNEVIKLGWNFRDLVKEPHKAFLVQYMYYPDKDMRFGENFIYKYGKKKVFIEPEKWYNIKMRIKLCENPKKKDLIVAWVNNKKVLSKRMDLRKKKDYGINQMMFSLFFGGDDETWHTTKKEKGYFRKFVVNGK